MRRSSTRGWTPSSPRSPRSRRSSYGIGDALNCFSLSCAHIPAPSNLRPQACTHELARFDGDGRGLGGARARLMLGLVWMRARQVQPSEGAIEVVRGGRCFGIARDLFLKRQLVEISADDDAVRLLEIVRTAVA